MELLAILPVIQNTAQCAVMRITSQNETKKHARRQV